MVDDNIPTAIATDEMEVLGRKVRVYVLDDGRRVIAADDMQGILAAFASDGEDDDFAICEVCDRQIRAGDLAHTCSDGPTFCEEHAPTWADIRREYDEAKADGSFVDLFFDPEDAAVSDRVVAERIAAGDGDKKHVWPW